ncbi:protein mono-ADP-ribosyltransferase PARP15-like isoform X2 [Dreissena polymorpha]|uniref:protein mono-ADP-ribosyltransferase PARP15-like isoform X2 n=1 Tax=Dreissena polymorpha TaxID=45954 RepID=UPI00226568D2|nr:protein mono-ADP-ribosyltransferase PARP15-like isoform X2 [Dreissena polymorpha]
MKIQLLSIKVRRPEALAIVLDRKSSVIVIVGEVKEVDQLSRDIAKRISELQNDLKKSNKTATKTGRFQDVANAVSIVQDTLTNFVRTDVSVPKSKDMQSSTSELWSTPFGYPMLPMGYPFAYPNVPVAGIGLLPVSTAASPQSPSACPIFVQPYYPGHPGLHQVPLPPSWQMTIGDKTQIVTLNPLGQEYKTLAQRFCSETFVPMQNIVTIERIQNSTLYMQYYGKKKEMETANIGSRNPIERRLWLGTRSGDVTQNINQKGATLGAGVMFAVDARTALGYCQTDATGTKRMYYADVLTGDFCAGISAGISYITKPPSRHDPQNPKRCFDSTTDNVSAPGLFVIFHDAHAYPSFLITFR